MTDERSPGALGVNVSQVCYLTLRTFNYLHIVDGKILKSLEGFEEFGRYESLPSIETFCLMPLWEI